MHDAYILLAQRHALVPGCLFDSWHQAGTTANFLRFVLRLAVYASLKQFGIDRAVRAPFVATQATDAVGVIEVFEAVAQDAFGDVGQDLQIVRRENRQPFGNHLIAGGQDFVAGDLASGRKVERTRTAVRRMLPTLDQSFARQPIDQANGPCM